MRRDRAILWAEALESGRYVQALAALRGYADLGSANEFEYCCLGVLCDLSGVGTWRPAAEGSNLYSYAVGQLADDTLPPRPVLAWAGFDTAGLDPKYTVRGLYGDPVLLDRCDGSCGDSERLGTASHLNDAHGLTFDQIAYLVRVRWAPDTVPVGATLDNPR